MAMWFDSRKLKLPTAADALPGRSVAMKVSDLPSPAGWRNWR